MHFDLAHALVTAVIAALAVLIFRKSNAEGEGKRKFDWRIFVTIFVLVTLLNLVWPY